MDYETIVMERKGPVANLVLNRPEKLNAVSPRLLEELSQALDELSKAQEIRAVVIRGSGRAFSSGTDLQALAGHGLERLPSAFRYHLARMQETYGRLASLERPVLAQMHGYALGAAMELALACDFRICTTDTIFSLPEVQYCLVPDLGGCQRLARTVGLAKAKELVMLGRRFNGVEAERMGIVHKAVAAGDLETEVSSWVEEILKLPPSAVGLAKRVVDLSLEASLDVGLDYTGQVQAALIASHDFMEAVRARLEGREPRFQGD